MHIFLKGRENNENKFQILQDITLSFIHILQVL